MSQDELSSLFPGRRAALGLSPSGSTSPKEPSLRPFGWNKKTFPAVTPEPEDGGEEELWEGPIFPPTTSLGIQVKDEDDQSDWFRIDDMLNVLLDREGSDLHLSAGAYPTIRVHGDMIPLTQYPRLSGELIAKTIFEIVSTSQKNTFENEKELDFAYTLAGRSRFRVNIMQQQHHVGAVMRAIPWEIKTIEELGLPEQIREWASLPRGLVLITGTTGSGKSTTLAAIIDHANRTRAGHIITIEDPIEFVHPHQLSIVDQREVGEDTKSFAAALKHVLRQDPDIILVGELRDLETISVALTAAETGHLVFGTLHTQSAEETINRIIDVFPDSSQDQIRTQLAGCLQGIACQTLLKKIKGGRCVAVEIMIGTPAIRNLIREKKTEQMQSIIQAGAKFGMQTLDSELEKLVLEGTVDWKEAADKSTNYSQFIERLHGEEGIKDIERRTRARSESSAERFVI